MTDFKKMSTRGTALDDTIFTGGTILATTYGGMHDYI